MEDEEALQTSALVRQLTESVEDEVDDLLADGVVAAGVVVGGVLLPRHQLLGMEQLPVGSGADLICRNGGLNSPSIQVCSRRYIISSHLHPHRIVPHFSPSLISLMVSVDVKHHVYLLHQVVAC